MTTRLEDLLGPRTQEPDDTVVVPAAEAGSAPADGPAEGPVEDDGDDLFADDDALRPKPRTSRFTLVLVALLILVIGFFLGVQVERAADGLLPRPGGGSSATTTGG